MPLAAAIVPAVIGAGAAVYSSSQQKKAANKAQAAQDAAAQQQLQLQREQFDRVVGLNQPFIEGGYAGFDALLTRLLGGGQPGPSRPAQRMTYDRAGNIVPVSANMSVAPSAPRPALGGGQPLGSMAGGLPARTGDTGPPGPAPAGKKWVHGPEGYVLMDDRPSVSFSDAMGGLGFGGRKTTGGPAGTSPVEPTAYGGSATQADMSNPAYFAGGATAPQASPQASAPQSGGADWQAYLDANPDVAENARQRAAAEGVDPLTVAQEHYQLWGKDENRALPMQPSQAFQADPNAPLDYMNMARPDAPAAPEFTRPEAMQFQDYGTGPQFSWDPSQIAKDPGFLFETAETTKGVNAGAAARGKLRSGDAARALQDRLFGVAHTYGNDYFNRALSGYGANRNAFESNRNYGTNLTQYQQNRADNLFGDDRAYDTARWNDQRTYGDARFDAERNYQTNRYDNQTNNLFRLTGIGAGAAGAVSGAGAAFANNAGNIFGNQADAASAAAQQRAAANAGMVGAIGGAAGNIFANWGGGVRTPTTSGPQTVGQAWNTSIGGGWQTPHNPNFVNTGIRVF